jgi:hypothetical protein
VTGVGGSGAASDLFELFLPAFGVGALGQGHLAAHPVQQCLDHLVFVPDVGVEGGRAGLQCVGNPPHGQRVESLGVDDVQGGVEDGLPAQPSGGPSLDRIGPSSTTRLGRECGEVVVGHGHNTISLDTNSVRIEHCSL